jgi:hypothetical protein
MDNLTYVFLLVLLVGAYFYMRPKNEYFSYWGGGGYYEPAVINPWDVRRFEPTNYGGYGGFGGIWNQLSNPHRGRGAALFGGGRRW